MLLTKLRSTGGCKHHLSVQVYNRGLVDERLAAALTHIGMTSTKNEEEARRYAMTTVIMRCCQLLLSMTPLEDDLTTLADDPGTEPQNAAYYQFLLKTQAQVSLPSMSCPAPAAESRVSCTHSTRCTACAGEDFSHSFQNQQLGLLQICHTVRCACKAFYLGIVSDVAVSSVVHCRHLGMVKTPLAQTLLAMMLCSLVDGCTRACSACDCRPVKCVPPSCCL